MNWVLFWLLIVNVIFLAVSVWFTLHDPQYAVLVLAGVLGCYSLLYYMTVGPQNVRVEVIHGDMDDTLFQVDMAHVRQHLRVDT